MRRFQVIQGGKQDRADSRRTSAKIFRAYSFGNLTRGDKIYHGVRFNWYCLERTEPIAPYEDLVADFEGMDVSQQNAMQKEVDRYFSEQEVRALSSYLSERYGLQLATEEVALPLKKKSGFFEEGNNVIYDFLELCAKLNYPLAFKVWGYYTLDGCLSTPDLDNAILFIRRSLELLGLVDVYSSSDLELVVKTLHENEGLVVKKQREMD